MTTGNINPSINQSIETLMQVDKPQRDRENDHMYRKFGENGHVVFELCEQTDGQTDRQTDR